MSTKCHLIYKNGLTLWFDCSNGSFYYYNLHDGQGEIIPKEEIQELVQTLQEYLKYSE